MFTILTLADFGLVAVTAALTIACILACARLFWLPVEKPKEWPQTPKQYETLSFDFGVSGALVCTNAAGAKFLANLDQYNPDWDQFRTLLSDRYPELREPQPASPDPCSETLAPSFIADPMELVLEHHINGTSVLLRGQLHPPKSCNDELHFALSSLNDIELVREVNERSPFPIWESLPDGTIGWANAHYKSLSTKISGDPTENSAPIFNIKGTGLETASSTRVSLRDTENNRSYWFDVSRQKYGAGYLNFAVDIRAVIDAETAQRNFVQTLAKTFAHLAIGLAIFDRNRQLVLFNPSLIDLTELRVDYLTARPNLFSFFDQLRDKQVMPEPKSYASWRERIANVISAASDDNFCETWHLSNGLTYRVTGRPHPDGAIAFLFEDISAEISLTRRFRGEAEVVRSALDAMEDGIAIFDSVGFLQQSNRALRQFSNIESGDENARVNIQAITQQWQGKFQPSPAWGEIRDFVTGNVERETWTATLRHKDGQTVGLQVSPLASGATLVSFSLGAIELSQPKEQTSDSKQSSNAAA